MDKVKHRQQRLAARRLHLDTFHCEIEAYHRVKAEFVREFRSLLGIFEVAGGQVVGEQELVNGLGFADHEVHFWQQEKDDGYKRVREFGGGMIVLKSRTGQYRTLIAANRPQTEDYTDEIFFGRGISLLFHEAGHVADFEQGLNLVPGKRFELVAAEAFAHSFACERMMKGNFYLNLKDYLRQVEDDRKCEIESVRQAAETFAASDVYRRAKAFAATPFNEIVERIFARGYTPEEAAAMLAKRRKRIEHENAHAGAHG